MKRITFLKKGISLVCAILMLTAVLPTALAAEYTSDDCYVEGYDTSVEIVEEGAVLLKNANGILPLQDGAKVTLLGSMSYNYVGGDDDNTVMMDAAFIEAGLDVNMQAWNWLETMCGGKRGVRDADPSGLGDWDSYAAIHEFPIEEYEKAKSEILVEGYCDTAIVTLSRTAAEGSALSMDLDGDGRKELAVLSPFHGDTFSIYQDRGEGFFKVYECPDKMEFLHAVYGGPLCRIPRVVIGFRKGERNLVSFSYCRESGTYEREIIDRDCGPANVCHYMVNQNDVIISANRETDEIAMYTVTPSSDELERV